MPQQAKKPATDMAYNKSPSAFQPMGICSVNIGALVESGQATANVFRDIGTQIIESGKLSFSDFKELSRESFACRTIHEVMDLQNKAVQQVCDNYFNTTTKLRNALFDACAEALAPITERTNLASDKIRKAIAA